MNRLNRTISCFWLYPIAIFAVIGVLPWWEPMMGTGNLLMRLPLATAYVNDFEGWPLLLAGHIAATVTLSLIAIGLHLAFRKVSWLKAARRVGD